MTDRVDQLPLFGTLEEAEAIAEESRSQVRDRAVRLLQSEGREGDARPVEASVGTQSG